MNMSCLNCWIDRTGKRYPVYTGQHMADKPDGACIRVSTPENRRTWSGIQIMPNATPAARLTLRGMIRYLRGSGIRIEDGMAFVDCQPGERPNAIYNLIGE